MKIYVIRPWRDIITRTKTGEQTYPLAMLCAGESFFLQCLLNRTYACLCMHGE